jgi:hypothetical protein
MSIARFPSVRSDGAGLVARCGVGRQNPNWPSGLALLVGVRPSSNVVKDVKDTSISIASLGPG